MSAWPSFIDPQDLAPGDQIPHADLPPSLELCRIESADNALFDEVYLLLEAEFGRANEIETRAVLTDRLSWRANQANAQGFAMAYELLALKVDGQVAAVRDHSATISHGGLTVHLSHVLVLPEWRRKGLATVPRTLPVSFAKRTAALAGCPEAMITLFCEMEPAANHSLACQIRRKSYENAGFLGIPAGHGYLQPDFRAQELIQSDPAGAQPVALDILFRRLGREEEKEITGAELIVDECALQINANHNMQVVRRLVGPDAIDSRFDAPQMLRDLLRRPLAAHRGKGRLDSRQ